MYKTCKTIKFCNKESAVSNHRVFQFLILRKSKEACYTKVIFKIDAV